MSKLLHGAAIAEILAQLDDAVFVLAADGTIASCNAAAGAIYGFTATEVTGESFARIVPPELHEIELRRVTRAATGERTRTACTPRLRADGTRIIVSSMVVPIRDEGQSVVAIAAIERDITRDHALAAELLQAKRFETVGRLASGTAQEINNINTAILGLVDFVAKHVAHDPGAWADLDEIGKQVRRASRLARQLLTFGERRGGHRPVDINEMLRATAPLLQCLVSERVRIQCELEPGDLLVLADEGQLEIVVCELTKRVADTLCGSGRLHVATQRVGIDADALPAPAGVPTGEYARITIRGIRGDAAATPTNEPSLNNSTESNALSLATVSSVLLGLNGHLCRGELPGEVMVYVPAARVPTTTGVVFRGDAPASETILLVEDEPAVRDVVARALRAHGFHVLEAADGEDALSAAQAYNAPIHLVISDVIMPKMDGRALFEQLRSWYPNLRFLFVSGYASGAIGTAELRGPATDFLAKPFNGELLYVTVRALLDRAVR